MSIETLLTLVLTAALLVCAFVLRLVVLGLLGVGLRLAGKDTAWLRPQRATAEDAPRRERLGQGRRPSIREMAAALRPRVAETSRRTRSGLGAAGATLLAVAAALWTAMARGADRLERWADRTNARLAPATIEIASAAKRSAADIGKYLVAGIATIQHVVLLLAGWVQARVAKRPPADREETPPPKVIDLDHDEDPLPPRSTRRPSAGARL